MITETKGIMSIEEIIKAVRVGFQLTEEHSAILKTVVKDIIQFANTEYTEATEDYEKYGWRTVTQKVEPVQVPTDREKLLDNISAEIHNWHHDPQKSAYKGIAQKVLSIVEKRGDIPVEKKVDKVLLTTVDGVNITDPEQWVYRVSGGWKVTEKLAKNAANEVFPKKCWADKENAQEYIEYEKPCLSQREINEILTSVTYGQGSINRDEYKERVKCALDTYVMHKLSETK